MTAYEEDASSVCHKCGHTFDVHALLSPDCNGETGEDMTDEPISEQELQEIEKWTKDATMLLCGVSTQPKLDFWPVEKLNRLVSGYRRLRARLEAVIGLHHHDGYQHDGSAACRCGADHPCPTRRAAEGSED